MNLGFQHEFTPGLIFSLDYVRNVGTRTLLGVDVNHGGAASTFNLANAIADRDAAQIAAGDLPVERIVTSSVALDGAPDAFAQLASGTADEIKVLVEQ